MKVILGSRKFVRLNLIPFPPVQNGDLIHSSPFVSNASGSIPVGADRNQTRLVASI